MEKTYLRKLKDLEELCQGLANTPMLAKAKIETMVLLNMRYERIKVDRNLAEHPYPATERIIEDCHRQLRAWSEIAFAEAQGGIEPVSGRESMEGHHRDLFQKLWTRFSEEEYAGRISRYIHRLKINSLADGFLKGKRCIDLGCGHGNFAHAMLQAGAEYVLGVDFGTDSIRYAEAARRRLGIPDSRLEFKVANVHDLPLPDAAFDFAVQNGVFHHLADENKAYLEAHRVLKADGWMWIYSDGQGAINRDLWDTAVRVLSDIPVDFVLRQLENLNLETGKRYHLGDGLNAVYRSESWNGLTRRLSTYGFGNFRRLVGGFPTDFDHDVIASDRYGKEKFGEGDLRLLAQKVGGGSAQAGRSAA